MNESTADNDYSARLAAEMRKWGEHLKVEASGEWLSWIDHPIINHHYHQRALVDGLPWMQWVTKTLNGPAERSLDLGCGGGTSSIAVYASGASKYIEGLDLSEERIASAEDLRCQHQFPGEFRAADTNRVLLPENTYDLVFSVHSFHHFLELEHVMEQVHQALTPRGLFILEEFVGPTQFQWTDQQIDLVRSLISLVPERLRKFRWDAIKHLEGRPTPEEVVAVSPFESIRSADILPLFRKYFDVIVEKRLGGTIQHLFYNGIAHNFSPSDEDAVRCLHAIMAVEDALIDSQLLPSDFVLIIGKRKDAA